MYFLIDSKMSCRDWGESVVVIVLLCKSKAVNISCLVVTIGVKVVGHLGGLEREGFPHEMRTSVPGVGVWDHARWDGGLSTGRDGDPALLLVVAVAVSISHLHTDENRVDVVWHQPTEHHLHRWKHSPGK